MAKGVIFTRESAGRIGAAVRRVEKMPQADAVIRGNHKPRSVAGTALYWAEITAKTDDTTYTGDIYNDRNADALASDVTVRVHDLAAGETIANGTFLPVALEPWTEGDPAETVTYWTVKQQIGLF